MIGARSRTWESAALGSPRDPGVARGALAALLVAFGLYAALFIYRTSFSVGGERYFVLFDDEMVSMRYARNLAQGFGLVWNPGGERVEGYTNLLWVLYMAVLHLLPVPASKLSALVQATGALLLGLTVGSVWRLTRQLASGRLFPAVGAAVLVAFYLPLDTWSLQGTEVSALAALLSGAAYLLVRRLHGAPFTAWPYVLLGSASLVRLDMVVPLLVSLGGMLWVDGCARRRHLAWGAGLLALCLGGQTLFRLAYYGDPLPNTYYLKLTGFPVGLRIARGLDAAVGFVGSLNPLVFVLPAALLVNQKGRRDVLLLFALIGGQLAYSVYVGGDAWEWWHGSNRFISPAMPLFFVLVALALDRLTTRWPTGARAGLLTACLVVVNAGAGTDGVREWLLLSPGLNVQGNATYTRIGVTLRELTTPQATIAVVWAGATPYFAERTAIDLLGKSDRRIAHEEARPEVLTAAEFDPRQAFVPGHIKWDFGYSIGARRPDVVIGWLGTIPEPMPYTPDIYVPVHVGNHPVFLRRDSPQVHWERAPPA